MADARVVSLGARVHLLVKPARRAPFIELFKDVLGCNVLERDFGFALPLLLVTFEDGSAFSVEFTEDAPDACGTWIEFRANDVQALQKKLRDAEISDFQHPGSPHTYFRAPGGQVFRLLDVSYKGP